MRLSDLVLTELARDGLGFREQGVYLAAYAHAPESMAGLARAARLSRKTVTRACRVLAAAGWMSLRRASDRLCPVALIPKRCQVKLGKMLEARYSSVDYRGEFLMKRFLDMWVRCDVFVDNARPDFLCNPTTGESLEYDRHYELWDVAFEFNGPQHYGRTEWYEGPREAGERIARDLVKESLSRKEGVELVVVRAADLEAGRLARLVPAGLPRQHVDQEGPLFETWARLAGRYRGKVQRDERGW